MIELLLGLLLVAVTAAFSLFIMWRSERDDKQDAEAKVRAHNALQEINDDIASGGDVYLSEQLRKHTRDL